MNIMIVKPIMIITCFMVTIIILIMGGASNCPDYMNYESMYYNAVNFSWQYFWDPSVAYSMGYCRDFGYSITNYIGNELGLTYQDYKFVSSLIFLMTLFIYTWRIIKNKLIIFLCLYIVYPYLMDVIQVRNFMFVVFLFMGIYYLTYAKKNRRLKFIALMMIAATFHTIALLYLPFVFFENCIKKWTRFILYILILIGLLMPFYADWIKTNWMFAWMLLSGTDTSLAHYAQYVMNTNDGLAYLARYFLLLFIVMFLSHIKDVMKNADSYLGRYTKNIYWLSMYCLIFLPLFPMFGDLGARLLRNLLYFVIVGSVIGCSFEENRINRIVVALTAILIISTVGWLELYNEYLRDNVQVILSNNVLYTLF